MSTLQLLITGSVVATLAYLGGISVMSVVAALRAGGRREDAPDSYDALAASRLTMPVSVVVPVGTSTRTGTTIAQLLELTYPEFEVIVVVDSPLQSLEPLVTEWQLESREFFYRRTLDTAPVRRIFRSLRDPRLMIVEKDAEHRSDAVNCGVNLARFRFVAVVPPDVTFDSAALLRAMAPALRDPVSIVGVGSHVERTPGGDTGREARFQRLRSIRSLMFTRLFWGHLRRGLGSVDGVVIWRRDAVLQANGFSKTSADPDLEMMFKLQNGVGAEDRRFVRNEDAFGRTGTRLARDARGAARARQRAALQMTASWGPGAGQSLGLRTFAYFLESELITPFAQLWVVVATIGGAAAGWFTWTTVVLALVLLSFGTAAVSTAALLLRGAHPEAPERLELRGLLTIAPLEVLVYRPLHAWSRLAGVFSAGPTRG
jgi:hypothetical protein